MQACLLYVANHIENRWEFLEFDISGGLIESSLRADSADSLKRSEVPLPVESAHQQHKACPKSRVLPRLQELDVTGGKRSLLFSFSLIDLV